MMGEKSEMFFISYASEDEPRVRPVRERLLRDVPGVKFWFDKEDIPVGADWDLEIKKAIRNSGGMILVLSSNSVEKEGYVQKEFKWAIDRAEEMPEGHPFLFWVRLDKCSVPSRLSKWQGCDLFGNDTGYVQLKDALRARVDQLRAKRAREQGSLPERRIAFLATEKFPLSVLEGVYRECTNLNFERRSGPIPTYDLKLQHGAATILPVDPTDMEYTRLERQIHLFHPDWIVVLGLGSSHTGNARDMGRLVTPSQIHPYNVREATKNGVRDYELVPDGPPYLPNLQLASTDLAPAEQRKVGAISTRMDLVQLRRQIVAIDLDIVELEDAWLFSLASAYTKEWMLLSATAGPLGSTSHGLESAAFVVSKKVMQMLGLEK